MLCTEVLPGTRRSAGLCKTELRGTSNPIRAVMLPAETVPNDNRWPSRSARKIPRSGPGGSRMQQELCRAAKASRSRSGLRRVLPRPLKPSLCIVHVPASSVRKEYIRNSYYRYIGKTCTFEQTLHISINVPSFGSKAAHCHFRMCRARLTE
jgi:hypothetical protein